LAQTEVQEPLMAMFSRRPASLAHLSDEAAARALSKHFGNIGEAAKDLGVDRKDLRRLTWSNPAILDAAHERIDLFVITMQGELVGQAMHGSSRVRQCAIDGMYRVAAIPDHPIGKAFAGLSLGLLARAPRARSVVEVEVEVEVEAALAREAAAERELERVAEFDHDRRREREGEEMVAEIEPLRTPWASGWRDVDPVSEESSSVTQPSIEPAPVESELPIWPGDYPPPPLVANRYQPWALSPRRECKHEQEPRRRPSRGGWR
jgi:hypothetical protein